MKGLVSKIIIIILLCFCMFSLLSSQVYAQSIEEIMTKADGFIKTGQEGNGTMTIKEDSIKTMSELIYNTLLIAGIVIAVIVGIFIGIKFMTSSIEEKAKIKETLIAYVAGCAVIFGAFTIWKIVVTILQSAPSA